ncbi:MAG: hypothetical protein J0J15_03750, partial [Mesorhizobium sp.]|nr:hypothetical protein [Mesorhizobium sp.]
MRSKYQDDFIAFFTRPNGFSRVPDGNETVKKQAVGAKLLQDAAAGVRQAERLADVGHGPRQQEATALRALPLDNAELVVDALGRYLTDSLRLAADSV